MKEEAAYMAQPWQELGLEGSPRAARLLQLWHLSPALGSHPLTTHRVASLSWPLSLVAGPGQSSKLVHAVLLPALAHDREGISFEALTGNCPLAPHQLFAAGHPSVVSFPSFGIQILSTKNPNQKDRRPPPTLAPHDANPGKA